MRPDRTRLLAAAEASPVAAAAHDKDQWIGLFAPNGSVEDPVGSRAHVGPEQLSRFFDTFVAPRSLAIHSGFDVVDEDNLVVVRDVTIEVSLPEGPILRFPAVLRYDLAPGQDSGEDSNEDSPVDLKISALRAYWELPRMGAQLARHPASGARVSANLVRALVKNQGARGALGFAGGLRGPTRRQRRSVIEMIAAAAGGDLRTATQLLGGAYITTGDSTPVGVHDLAALLARSRPVRVIGAGSTVCVSVESSHHRGVLFVELDRTSRMGRVWLFRAENLSPPTNGNS